VLVSNVDENTGYEVVGEEDEEMGVDYGETGNGK
jgi:hypothetical protein